MITGLKIISVYDPATGTVVQLNRVATEGDFKKDPLFVESSKGSQSYSGDDSSFEFMSYDDTGFDQLETWMKNQTSVRLVTYGVEDHVFWYEDALITVRRKIDFKTGGLNGFVCRISKKGGTHNIFVGTNLLYMQNGWRDGNADQQADNYYFAGSLNSPANFSFGSDLQTITLTGQNGSLSMYGAVIYPISGASLSFVAGTTQKSNAGATDVRCVSYTDSVVTSVSSTLDAVANVVTPANTYKLLLFLVNYPTAVPANTVYKLQAPYLGVKVSQYQLIKY